MRLISTHANYNILSGRYPGGFWLACWLRVLLLPIYVWMMAIFSPAPRALFLALAGLVSLIWALMCPRLWRIQRRMRGYRTLASRRTVLHHPPGFAGVDDLPGFLQLCEGERDDLAQLFGFPLRRRLHVFIVPTPRDIEALFGRPFGGTVWPGANAVLLTAENLNRVMLRHELGHLFSIRWNPAAPPIMAEGLSTWLEAADRGRTLDAAACEFRLLSRPDLKKLLDPRYFYAESHRYGCYTFAGSFTGFLIRRHGWDRYLRFYRKTKATRFESRFRKFFGLSLMEAQQRWLDEILAMASLNQRFLDDGLFNEFA
jgi:hypothetical protein